MQPVVYLHSFDVPTSFSGKALLWRAQKEIKYHNVNKCKCLRSLLTLIYLYAVVILIPFGILYHSFMALTCKLKAVTYFRSKRLHLLAKEHFNAALLDLCSILPFEIAIEKNQQGEKRMSFFWRSSSILGTRDICELGSGCISSCLVKVAPLQTNQLSTFTATLPTGSTSHAFHSQNIQDMQKGYFRLRELVFNALKVQFEQSLATMPSLSDTRVYMKCLKASWDGRYNNITWT